MQRKWKRRWQRVAKIVLTPVAAGMLLLSAYSAAYANPTGGMVTSGAANIATNGSTMTVNQSTNKAIINWQSFSIGNGETVNFVQPGASSVALNRVIGNNPSAIYGTLNANGKVFLVNPNGVLFAKGAQVNTGGLVASTLDIADSNFLNGNYAFSGSDAGSVVNQGNITAASEAVFLGPQVANEGVIAAKVVGLGAGHKVRLDFSGDQLLSLTVDTGAASGSASNSGTITANGGTVVMSAGTADALLNTVVNNIGVIRAQTVNNQGGVIKLLGNTVNVGGTLDASAPNGGNGGFIETSGNKVKIADSAIITTKAASGKTGTWLIDPDGFTIAATGGDITGAALSSQLALNNVTIQSTDGHSSDTSGNVNVNDAVTWSSSSKLELHASNDININAVITAPSGALTLNAYNDDNPIDNATNNININAINALNVANIGGYSYGKLNINQSQTWTTPPDLSGLIICGLNVNAPVTWSSGTLILAPYGDFNINPGGSLAGPTLDMSSYNFNLNAANAFHVATVIGEHGYAGVYGDFNINQPQTWTTAPDLSALGVAGNTNVNAALTWSSGTLTLSAGNHPWSGWGDYLTHNVNVNAALTGPSLAFNLPIVPDSPDLPPNTPSAVNISAVNALNVTTVSGAATGGFNIAAAQTWSTAPTVSLTADINVNAPLTWSTGTLTLGGNNANVNAVLAGPSLAFNTSDAVSISAVNALNVTTVKGTAAGGFNIAAAQTWSTAPTISLTGDINVDAPLTWSTGALTLGGTSINVNAPLIGSIGTLKLAASNNIELNTALSWSSGTLTLNAGKSIFVNAVMTANDTANLAASYGRVLDANGNPTAVATAGSNADGTPFGLYTKSTDSHGNYTGRIDFASNGAVMLNGQAYTVINSIAGFGAIGTNLSGNYVLGSNLSGLTLADLSAFGFSSGGQFTGNFNGLGHALTTVVQPSITLPSSIGNLSSTNLILNSAGGISANSSVTSGAGILTLNGTASTIAPSAVVSGMNIAINAPVSWSSNDPLTITAYDNLFINAAITATGANAGLALNANTGSIYVNNAITLSGANAALAMNYGGDYNILTKASYSGAVLDASSTPVAKQDTSGGVYGSVTLNGGNATLKMNGQDYTLIHGMADFDKINQAGGVGYYALAQNLDASGTTYTKAVVGALDGTFAGLGHTISDLKVNSTEQRASLFGTVGQNQTSVIRDIGLTNVDISSTSSQIGGIAGLLYSQDSISINNVYVTGNITGNGSVGGIIGGAFANTTINDAFFSGNIYSHGGGSDVGGLVGNTLGDNIIIRNAHANADIDVVTDWYVSNVGGLIGNFSSNGEVSGTYATGNIKIVIPNQYADNVGGLIGTLADGASLSKSFAAVNIYIKPQYSVQNSEGVGGLVGTLSGGVIDNVYAKGNITIDVPSGSGFGFNSVGGLVGRADTGWPASEAIITNAAAYGNVYAGGTSSWIGGFIGWSDGATISNGQAYGDVSGSNNAGGFAGGNNGNILNSAAHGAVTGGYGFVAINNPDATISKSYYNGEANSTGVGRDYDGNSDTTGLTGEQFKDLQYYLDGTIDQVLADRAARQAFLAATKQVAVQQSTGQQARRPADTVSQPGQAMGNAWRNLLDTLNLDTLWQSATNQNAPAGSGSARIQSVQANGVEYQLEDNSTDANTNAGGNSTDKKQ